MPLPIPITDNSLMAVSFALLEDFHSNKVKSSQIQQVAT